MLQRAISLFRHVVTAAALWLLCLLPVSAQVSTDETPSTGTGMSSTVPSELPGSGMTSSTTGGPGTPLTENNAVTTEVFGQDTQQPPPVDPALVKQEAPPPVAKTDAAEETDFTAAAKQLEEGKLYGNSGKVTKAVEAQKEFRKNVGSAFVNPKTKRPSPFFLLIVMFAAWGVMLEFFHKRDMWLWAYFVLGLIFLYSVAAYLGM